MRRAFLFLWAAAGFHLDCSADRISQTAADVSEMSRRMESLSKVGRQWARSVADAVMESGSEGKKYGEMAVHFAGRHADIIDDVFSVSALQQEAAERSASLLEKEEEGAAQPLSSDSFRGAESLDRLSSILGKHEEHAKAVADLHESYTEMHAEVTRIHGIAGVWSLAEVAAHGEVGELGLSHQSSQAVTRKGIERLKERAKTFLDHVRKLWEYFKKGMTFLRKILLHISTNL